MGTCFGDDELLEVLHRLPILSVLELTQIFFFALVVHRRVHGARFNDHDVDAKQHQFSPQHVRHAFKTKFGSAIGTEKRDSNFCTARGDVHDAPGGPLPLLIRSQKGREGLDYDKRGDHVDLQLPPVLAGPQMKQRPTDHDSRIVHQANQIPIAYHGADLLSSLMNSIGVRNVHHERHEAVPELFLQTIGVSPLAYGTEHAKSL